MVLDPFESTTSRFIVWDGIDGERRDAANMNAEMMKPTAPAIIKITPNVERLKPWFCTAALLCAETAKYMMAPVTAEIALSTIPAKPIIIPLFACDENQNDNPVVAVSSPQFYDRSVSSENKITSTHNVSVARIQHPPHTNPLQSQYVRAPYVPSVATRDRCVGNSAMFLRNVQRS
jgi:hypothetical protein